MPPKRINCDECGMAHIACPDCGRRTISFDMIPGQSGEWGTISPEFEKFGIYAEIGEELSYSRVCWECGFEEDIILRIEEDE